ncbi:hypothetical protein ACQ4PT_054645 [Festuca glaucescens]
MVVQTCHAIRAMRSDEKPAIIMVSNAGVALAGSTLMNQQDGNNINILRTSVEEPADDCSAETVEVTHLNNGVGESIGHIRVRTPDRAGLVSTVGSISKSWQSSNVAHNVMESQSEERRSADYSDAAVSGSTTPVRPHGMHAPRDMDARDACGSGSRVLGSEESRGNYDAPPFDAEMVTAEPTEEDSEMDNMFKGEYPAVEQICEAGTPEEGMQFDSRESAFQYFALFARRTGFAIRKYTSLNSRRMNTMKKQVFVCTKQGHTHVSDKVVKERKTSSLIKCMCPAKIVARKTTKGWVYRTMDLQHNHPLHPSDWLIRFAKCHKSMTHQDKEFIRILHLGVDQGSSVDTNNNDKLKGDADAAIGDAGITTDINEPLLMVGPTAGFNDAADTAGSDNEQSSEVHTSQLTITQSQSVDGTETPTHAWQVEEQLAEERVKIDQKKAAKKRKIAIDGVKKRLVLTTTTEDSAEDDHDQHDDMDDQPAPLAVQFPRYDTQAAKQAKPRRHKKRRASTSTNPGPQQKRRRSSRLSKKGNEAVDTGHRRSDGDGSGDGHDPDYNVSSEEYDEHEHDDDVSPGATDDDREGKKKAKGRKLKRNYRLEKLEADDQSNGGKKLHKDTGANYTIRCSLNTIKNLRDIMTPKQKAELINVGWGFILDYKKHVSPDQPDGQFADDALIYDQIISAELTKEKGTETTMVDTKQSSEGNANPIIDDVVTDQDLKTMSGSAVSVLQHDNQHERMDIVPYLMQELHLENTTCAMNEEIDVQPIVQENTKIMFPVLDNPENRRGILGHCFTLAIDIVDRKFRVYDSLREPGNKDVEKICTPMVKLLKHMWNEGFRSTQSNVRTLHDYEVVYEHMPLQENGCDCGFFMLYMLENCTGQHIPDFNKDDIEQYKELFLMKMLTAKIFDISVEAMDDSILCTGESEFNRMFPNKSFQDCRDQILWGIAVREVEHSQREMVALEETSQIEIDKKRNANRPAKIKASMHNDERRRND